MTHQTHNKRMSGTAGILAAILTIGAALSGGTMARADDPPKKAGDGKVEFRVGKVTKTPDKNTPPPKPTPPKQSDPNKGKSQPPKGN